MFCLKAIDSFGFRVQILDQLFMGFNVSSFPKPLQCYSDLSHVCATTLTHRWWFIN